MPGPRPAVAEPTSEEFERLKASPIVKIYAGKRDQPYLVPKDLISWYSPYFRACFNGNFKEGVEGVLRLPDENALFVKAIVDYVYGIHEFSLFFPEPRLIKFEGELYNASRIYFDFVRFCDRFDICEAAAVAADGVVEYQKYVDILEHRDDVVFAFDRLHEDNPFLESLCLIMVKQLCNKHQKKGVARVEKFLLRNEKVAGRVMQVFIKKTVVIGGGRQLDDYGKYETEEE